MKSIIITKIESGLFPQDFAIICYPFSTSKIRFEGINLTVIFLVPVEFDEMTISCHRFINLSTITCQKATIVAATYINMGQLKSEATPEIVIGDKTREHSFVPKEGDLPKIWETFWNAIDEKREEVSENFTKDVVTISKVGLVKGLFAVDQAVYNYSPNRKRKY